LRIAAGQARNQQGHLRRKRELADFDSFDASGAFTDRTAELGLSEV
jgi:hypothetical protein